MLLRTFLTRDSFISFISKQETAGKKAEKEKNETVAGQYILLAICLSALGIKNKSGEKATGEATISFRCSFDMGSPKFFVGRRRMSAKVNYKSRNKKRWCNRSANDTRRWIISKKHIYTGRNLASLQIDKSDRQTISRSHRITKTS